MRRLGRLLGLVAIVGVAGCASMGGGGPAGLGVASGGLGQAVSVLAAGPEELLVELANNPLATAAVADADRTLAWVADQVAAKKLSDVQATLARACPTAVKFAAADFKEKTLALKDALAGLAASVAGQTTGPQLIFDLTRLKYGQQPDLKSQIVTIRADLALRVDALAVGCGHLVPAKQINDLLRLAGKLGLATQLGPAAGLLP